MHWFFSITEVGEPFVEGGILASSVKAWTGAAKCPGRATPFTLSTARCLLAAAVLCTGMADALHKHGALLSKIGSKSKGVDVRKTQLT